MAGTVAQELLVQVRADTRDLQTFSTAIGKTNETIKLFAKESSAGLDAITKRITQLTAGVQQEGTRAESLTRLAAIESGLRKTLAEGNVTLAQRIQLETQAARAAEVIRVATEKSATAFVGFGKAGAGLDAITKRITQLSAGAQQESTRADSLQRLVAVEAQLQKALGRGNLTLEQRIQLEAQLKRTTDAIVAATTGLVPAVEKGASAIDQFAEGGIDALTQFGGVAGQSLSRVATLLTSPLGALGAAGVVFAAVSAQATKMAIDVEDALVRVGAALPTGTTGLEDLRVELKALSEETGKSQKDLAEAAQLAARTGAESAVATGQRVKAALTASIATGEDFQGILSSLDQVLDVFGEKSDGAGEALGKLFAATRGRSSLADTLAILQAAAPGLNKLGLDIDTATRALVALGERGLSVRRAGAELNDLAQLGKEGAASIRALAAEIPPLVGGLESMQGAADRVNNSAEKVASRLKTSLANALIELGNKLRPTNRELEQLLGLLERIPGVSSFKKIDEDFTTIGTKMAAAIATTKSASDEGDKAFGQVEKAVKRLSDAVDDGTADLARFGAAGLGVLRKNLEDFSKTEEVFKSGPDGLLGKIANITGAIDAARESLKKPITITVDAPKPGKVPTAEEIRARQEASKREAEAAQQQAVALRELGDALADLTTKANAGDLSLSDFDRALRELNEKAADPKLKLTSTDLAAIAIAAEDARTQLQQVKADDAAREFAELRDALLPEALRDYQQAFERLRQALSKKGLTKEQVDELVRLTKAAHDAEAAMRQTEKNISAIGESGLPALKQAIALQSQRSKFESELNLLEASGSKNEEKKLSLRARIQAIDAAIAKLAGEYADHTERANDNSRGLAENLENVASAAFGLATALLGADSTITKMLGGVQQIASGFRNVSELARNVKGGGGFGELFSTGAGIASALPGIGAILGGVGSIVASLKGKDDVEAQRRHEEDQVTLRQIRDGIFDIARSTASGASIGRVRDAIADPKTLIELAFKGKDFGANDFGRINDAQADKFFKSLGSSLSEVQAIAKDYNIQLDGSLDRYQLLAEALKRIDLKKFTTGLEGTLRLLEAQESTGAIAGVDALKKRIEILTGTDGVPALADALNGLLDGIDTAAGREAAIAKLQDLLANFGSLDVSQLGGLNPADAFSAIIDLIKRLQELQPKVKTAGEQFSEAMDLLGVTFEFSSADAATRLAKITETFRKLFPDLSASIDFSSVKAFDDSLQKIIAGFAANGELSDSEKAQIAALRALRDAFKAAVPEAKKFIDTLDLLAAQFDVFETSKLDQFNAVSKALGDKFGQIGQINQLLKLSGLDASNAEGRKAIRSMLEGLFKAVSADGIDETEEPLIDAIRQMLRGLGEVADEEAAANEKRLADAAAKRKQIRDQAERDIDVKDVTDPLEQFKIRFAAAVASIPGLADALGNLDVATEAGRKALDDLIADWVTHPEKLASVAEQLGIPLDELLNVFLGLESGSDAVNEALQRLADGAKTFADRVNEALSEIDFQIDLHNITDPLEKLKATVAGLAALDPRIAQAVAGFDLTSEAARKSVEAVLTALATQSTDPVLRQEILAILHALRAIPAPEVPGAGAGEPGTPGAGGTATTLQGTPQITVQQADRLTDIGRSQLSTLQAIRQTLDAMLALAGASIVSGATTAISTLRQSLPASLPALRPPALPSNVSVSGDVNITVPIEVHNVFNGLSKDERQTAEQIMAAVFKAIDSRKFREEIDRAFAEMAQQKALNAGVTARS